MANILGGLTVKWKQYGLIYMYASSQLIVFQRPHVTYLETSSMIAVYLQTAEKHRKSLHGNVKDIVKSWTPLFDA